MTTPRMRAADEDRQQAADRLAEHYTAGRLSTLEYDERVAQAYAVTYLDEMPVLFGDLPGADGSRGGGNGLFGSSAFGSGAGGAGVFGPGGFNPSSFGPAFGPAFAKARAAGTRGGRGFLSGLPRPLAVAVMVLLGITAVVVIAHVIVPLLVIGLIVFLVTRHRRGGPWNRQGGRNQRGRQWGEQQHWAA